MIGQAVKKSPPARKQKTCANPECATKFVPAKLGQKVCGWACGLAIAPANQEKARKALAQIERKEVRARKEKLKSRAEYAKEAQAVINRYVRLRDAHLGCISCDKPASWGGQWHCSHFRSVGAAPHIRFNLWNMHRACSICNNHLSGNIAGYRPRLIEKIGQTKVDWLESNHSVARHDIPYLKRIKAVFTKKCRRLEARIQCNAA
ncbi:recombination protein NinG [Pseudomonas abietaniphila]|uniref:Bacteriophage Lambda NinG protein n=1 Tax=Pseudomonas abietaniphila TaxID=89065 RepID=A0A1G8TC72_9PSED|nr:recombination protein NinG [Pseudomonas abietaniphila]SDJ39098.1 Bacteriophage Lambda NinG protein [Pseudomonas abietaniphila]